MERVFEELALEFMRSLDMLGRKKWTHKEAVTKARNERLSSAVPFCMQDSCNDARNGIRECCTAADISSRDAGQRQGPVQAIEENLGTASEKLTPKAIGNNILNYLSGSMAPLIPVLMCAGLFKTVGVILGPTMAGVVSETSDIYILMNML